MTQVTTGRERDLEEGLERLKRERKELEAIQTALRAHPHKLVNKNFWAEHFTVNGGDGHTYQSQSITDNPYKYAGGPQFIIYVTRDQTVYLENKETSHVLEKIEEALERVQKGVTSYRESLEEVRAFDEEAFFADLKELYKKHGEPKFWQELLDSSRGMYPNS